MNRYSPVIAATFREALDAIDLTLGVEPSPDNKKEADLAAVEESKYALTVHGCVNFPTAKETLQLVVAARLLCAGRDEEATRILKMVLRNLQSKRIAA